MPSPIIVLGDPEHGGDSPLGIDRATYRRRLADELGFSQVMTTTGVAASGEASRIAISDELRDDEAGYDHLGAPWLFASGPGVADVQRRAIANGGQQLPYGAVVVSRPFPAALPLGTTIELTSPLPVLRHLAVKGLVDVVDETLAQIPVPVRVEVAGTGDYAYSTASLPWITHEEQIRGIGLASSGLVPTPTTVRWRLVADGADRALALDRAMGADQTWFLEALCPADRIVFDGAAWAFSLTGGLETDHYRAAAPLAWVVALGMVRALRVVERLVRRDAAVDPRLRDAEIRELQARRKHWAIVAHAIVTREFPRPIQQRTAPMTRLVGIPAGAAAFTTNRD